MLNSSCRYFTTAGVTTWKKNPYRSAGSTALLKQGHLEHFAQDHVQVGFEYLQTILHNLSGNLGQCSVNITVKKFILIF